MKGLQMFNKSPLKWAGGKSKLLPSLLPILDKHREDVLIEPFMGSCTVSLNFDAIQYHLSDLNGDLVNFFSTISAGSLASGDMHYVLTLAESYFKAGRDVYNEIRSQFNKEPIYSVKRAAMFLYLNKFGFNGLCRYNQDGKFNVPVGKSASEPTIPFDAIGFASDRLKYASINQRTFQQAFFHAEKIPDKALIYCFDESTELLTSNGWKFVKDITCSDMCLGRNAETDEVDWVSVINTHSRQYEGDMYNYAGKSVDVCVTEDHMLLLHSQNNDKKIKLKASESIGKKLSWVCGGAVWNRCKRKTIEICGIEMPMKEFAYILGIFVTDGSVNKQGAVTISQSKPNIIEKIKRNLEICDIKYSLYERADPSRASVFYIPMSLLPFFKQFYIKENRKIPREFLDADVDTLSSILEGIIDGDGDNAADRKHIRISLASKPLVDNIMEIAIKLGKSSTFSIRQAKDSYLKSQDRVIKGRKPYYVISINETVHRIKRKTNELLKRIHRADVFCVTLQKWNNVVMRRNGKMCWIGQCDPPYVPLTTEFNYTADGFGSVEHEELKRLAKLSKHTTIISNHLTPYTEKLYSDADEVYTVDVKRTISCKGGERKQVKEIIAVYGG